VPSLDRASPDAVARLRDWWQERGLRIVAIQSVLHGRPDLVLFDDEVARGALTQYLVAALRVASGLGAGAVVFGAPRNRKRGLLSVADAERVAVAFFRDIGARALDLDTCVCVKPNPTEYGTDFMNTTAETANFVRLVDHPGIGLQLDAGAMALTRADVRPDVADSIAPVRHVHASEPFLAPLTAASPVHVALAGALRTAQFAGYVCLEMKPGSLDSLRGAAVVLRETYGD
jgi:D-psicose/D-tagatose/L-ribulose 3-epimerase